MKNLGNTGDCDNKNIDAFEQRATCMTVTIVQMLHSNWPTKFSY
jgi:hypothetical protein